MITADQISIRKLSKYCKVGELQFEISILNFIFNNSFHGLQLQRRQGWTTEIIPPATNFGDTQDSPPFPFGGQSVHRWGILISRDINIAHLHQLPALYTHDSHHTRTTLDYTGDTQTAQTLTMSTTDSILIIRENK